MNVVAHSYNQDILNNDKDVMVLYYSPTCKHCEALAPTYDEVGELLKPYANQLTVARIDATSNDISPKVSSYPTVKFFKSGWKDEPITFAGNRTANEFVKFVKDNCKQEMTGTLGDVLENMNAWNSHDEL